MVGIRKENELRRRPERTLKKRLKKYWPLLLLASIPLVLVIVFQL